MACQVRKAFRLFAVTATAALAGYAVVLALKAPALADALTREGGLIESAQIIPLVVALGIAVVRAARTVRSGGALPWAATAWVIAVALLKELALEDAFVVAPRRVHLFGTNFLTSPLLSGPHKAALLAFHGVTLAAGAYLLRHCAQTAPTAWRRRDEWAVGLMLAGVALLVATLADKSRVWLPWVGAGQFCRGSLNEVRRLVSQCVEEPCELLAYVMLAWAIGWMPLPGA